MCHLSDSICLNNISYFCQTDSVSANKFWLQLGSCQINSCNFTYSKCESDGYYYVCGMDSFSPINQYWTRYGICVQAVCHEGQTRCVVSGGVNVMRSCYKAQPSGVTYWGDTGLCERSCTTEESQYSGVLTCSNDNYYRICNKDSDSNRNWWMKMGRCSFDNLSGLPTSSSSSSSSSSVAPFGVPDLIIDKIEILDSRTKSGNKYLWVTVKNISAGVYVSKLFQLHLYVNPSVNPPTLATISSFTNHLNIQDFSNYETGESGTVSFNLPIGTNTIFAWVDRDNDIAEKDENNNTKSINYTYTIGSSSSSSSSQSSSSSSSKTSSSSSSPVNCSKKNRGDADCDSDILEADYIIWKCEFLGNGQCANPASNKTADFNGDTRVNLLDFEIWRENKN